MVGFVGGGALAVGGGASVAWFPLAPREVYVPWYRTSRGYVNNVNVTNTRVNVTQVTNVYNTTIINNNTTNITRVNYVNQHITNGVTAVHRDTFVNARPVAANVVRVDAKQIAEAPVSRAIPAQPVRASVMGAGRPVTNARPPETVANRPVVAVRQPPAPRAPFESRQPMAPNVRVENQGQPQPPTRTPAEPMRPVQPAPRPNEATRPQPPTMQPSQPSRPQPPSMVSRPGGPANGPRPGMEPQESRPMERPMPGP